MRIEYRTDFANLAVEKSETCVVEYVGKTNNPTISKMTERRETIKRVKIPSAQQAVWHQSGCMLAESFAGI